MTTDRAAAPPRTTTVPARRHRRRGGLRDTAALPLFAAALVVLGLAAGWGCDRSQPNGPPAGGGQAPPVSVFTAVQQEVSEWDEYPGRLAAIDAVEVRARVGGFVETAPFNEGAIVEKGAVLFTLDVRPYQAELERAQSDLAKAESQRKYAQSELERITALQPSGAASGREQLNATQSLETAAAAVASAKAAVETARLNVEWTKVVAPIKGRVGKKEVTPGNLVNGGTGQTTLLTTITSLDPIFCYFDVDEGTVRHYQQLNREQGRPSARDVSLPAQLAVGAERDFSHLGKIDFIDNRIQPGTGTINVRGVFPNPTRELLPGFYARVRVPGRGPYRAVLVPPVAIGSTLATQFVLVVGPDNTVAQKSVKLGDMFGRLQAVEGVKPGDKVIVNGLVTARPGVKVTPQEVPPDQYPVPPPSTRPTTVPATAAASAATAEAAATAPSVAPSSATSPAPATAPTGTTGGAAQ